MSMISVDFMVHLNRFDQTMRRHGRYTPNSHIHLLDSNCRETVQWDCECTFHPPLLGSYTSARSIYERPQPAQPQIWTTGKLFFLLRRHCPKGGWTLTATSYPFTRLVESEMSKPMASLPETTPVNPQLRHEVVFNDLLRAIEESESPELNPLLRALRQEIPEEESEFHAWFSSMFKSILQRIDFEKIFDDDVPNSVKDFLREYARAPYEGAPSEQGTNAQLVPHSVEPQSVSSALLNLGRRFLQLATCNSVQRKPRGSPLSLPPSPHFHHLATFLCRNIEPFPEILEADGKPMDRVRPGTKFENWGQTVENSPAYTFVARTEVGICNLVKWAAGAKKKVRVAGYRHTGLLFVLADLPSYSPPMEEIQKHSDLVGIEVSATESKQALCTIKAGTTNEMFREWCLQNRRWCLPFNVIMVEITFGGSNGPICHGAGLSTTTLSDLVAEFHYIDPHGNKKSISDPDQLRAASGCFGLLGICTAITLRLDAMSMAVMNPVKVPLVLAIPPPIGYKIPDVIDMSGVTPEDLEKARQEFVRRCEEDYYLEWFWYPLTKDVWVNTWKSAQVDDAAAIESLEPYPSPFDALIQWGQGWLAEQIVNTDIFRSLSGRVQALLMGQVTLGAMPHIPDPKKAIRTLTSEALHFRRGIRESYNLPVRWNGKSRSQRHQIIQESETTAPFSVSVYVRWDAISVVYSRDDGPMRLALEMRLTGGSNMILAPQRGNNFGTTSIEVLTIPNTPRDQWQSFLQQVADAWTGYTDSNGTHLNSRPHWAKEWAGLTVRGQSIEQYLKEVAYKDAIPEFRAMLEKIATAQGTTVVEMRDRFGNPFALLTQ
ncbi:cholesterol oxidase, substrate-binding domain-containing protein [Rhizoctonia solani AG-1 IA]|uniref:Cholesterol oxidase, substrate-binding domain-containing protein n=1 Tax=Thanatephorus cucumeris (strain AG1-IA) TaxID=983506 RepID=L8WIA6_THACA|nr:cholesterol oxidase, substrate-binding domain-containing protein [Rhizoctonia solani AG-1 IA]